jgi:hypothetical protein
MRHYWVRRAEGFPPRLCLGLLAAMSGCCAGLFDFGRWLASHLELEQREAQTAGWLGCPNRESSNSLSGAGATGRARDLFPRPRPRPLSGRAHSCCLYRARARRRRRAAAPRHHRRTGYRAPRMGYRPKPKSTVTTRRSIRHVYHPQHAREVGKKTGLGRRPCRGWAGGRLARMAARAGPRRWSLTVHT